MSDSTKKPRSTTQAKESRMGELARHATTSAAKGAGDLAGRVAAGAVVAAIVTVATGCPVTGFKAGAGTAGV